MRIWRGKELEHNGNYGAITLFIESSEPDLDVVEQILAYNPDITTLYFGAGELSVRYWDWVKGLPKFKDKYKIMIECSNHRLVPNHVSEYFDVIICRYKNYNLADDVSYLDKLQIKIREKERVYIAPAKKFEFTDIREVAKGQYSSDLELYNDAEEE